jgi:hypothetical protein
MRLVNATGTMVIVLIAMASLTTASAVSTQTLTWAFASSPNVPMSDNELTALEWHPLVHRVNFHAEVRSTQRRLLPVSF